MTVGRPDGHGGIEHLDWASEVVRLGEGVAATGRLDERRIVAALETLQRLVLQAEKLGAQRIVAVATEATRAAANGEDFLRRVREEIGVDVRIIDGDEEAALTFRGLAAELDLSGSLLIADIGGGSTELIAVSDGDMGQARSLELGSGRLTEQFVRADPPTDAELAACESEASRVIRDATGAMAALGNSMSRLILVGGTGEYLVRLLPDERPVSSPSVREVLAGLTITSAAELAARIEIPEARARVLPAGVAIIAAIAEQMKPLVIEIAHSGVRAGLLLETFRHADEVNRAGLEPGTERAVQRKKPKALRSAAQDGRAMAQAPFRETMKALIAERWTAVWAAIPVALAGEDIEGVHDVRVASRRLRAAMDVAAPGFPRSWYSALHRTAKEITGALGEVRDRDVLLEALRADRAQAPLVEYPGIDRLIDRMERERAAARLDMEAYLRELLAGPTWEHVERRFGAVAGETEPIGAYTKAPS